MQSEALTVLGFLIPALHPARNLPPSRSLAAFARSRKQRAAAATAAAYEIKRRRARTQSQPPLGSDGSELSGFSTFKRAELGQHPRPNERTNERA